MIEWRDRPTWQQAVPTLALRKLREGRGTHCVGDASETNSLGHPPWRGKPVSLREGYDLARMPEA
ncbi:MAG: hypothetical protein ABR881_24970 [Candidatus Sulfotelmatobacter sp.]